MCVCFLEYIFIVLHQFLIDLRCILLYSAVLPISECDFEYILVL